MHTHTQTQTQTHTHTHWHVKAYPKQDERRETEGEREKRKKEREATGILRKYQQETKKETKYSTRFLDGFGEYFLQILYELISLIRVRRHAGTAILQNLLDEVRGDFRCLVVLEVEFELNLLALSW
jgi:hypothetical protein